MAVEELRIDIVLQDVSSRARLVGVTLALGEEASCDCLIVEGVGMQGQVADGPSVSIENDKAIHTI